MNATDREKPAEPAPVLSWRLVPGRTKRDSTIEIELNGRFRLSRTMLLKLIDTIDAGRMPTPGLEVERVVEIAPVRAETAPSADHKPKPDDICECGWMREKHHARKGEQYRWWQPCDDFRLAAITAPWVSDRQREDAEDQ